MKNKKVIWQDGQSIQMRKPSSSCIPTQIEQSKKNWGICNTLCTLTDRTSNGTTNQSLHRMLAARQLALQDSARNIALIFSMNANKSVGELCTLNVKDTCAYLDW